MKVCNSYAEKKINPDWVAGHLYVRKLEIDKPKKELSKCEVFIAAGVTETSRSLVCLQDGLYWQQHRGFSSDIWIDVTDKFCLQLEDK